jgi:hypothetical protein
LFARGTIGENTYGEDPILRTEENTESSNKGKRRL